MKLYRPVGKKELELIEQSGYMQFPPRLPDQPIFYPVLNQKYAEEIAGKWNVKFNTDHVGYVTEFEIENSYISSFKVQTAGAHYHQEYWIPAEELANFNTHIIGTIRIIKSFE